MNDRLSRIVVFVLLLVSQAAIAAPLQLKKGDIRPTMEEMLGYHVEYKTLSPFIVKRSFKVYLEQFDPEKVYLLGHEVKPFLELSQDQLERVIKRYQSDDFMDYLAMNFVVQKGIKRARSIRHELEKELAANPPDAKSFAISEPHTQFAQNEGELRARIKKQLTRLMLSEKKFSAATAPWTTARREKIFALWEKRFQRVEGSYLIQDNNGKLLSKEKGEHYLSMHILKAMAKSLDSHTAYFSPEEAFEMKASLEKQFEGVGVVLRESVDGVMIADLIKGGPAFRSGKISVGDILVAVNGDSVGDSSYEEVLNKMKGDGKRELKLGFKRFAEDGKEQQFKVELQREKIVMQDDRLQFTSEPYGEGVIGKLYLPSFYESGDDSSCEKDMREAIKALKKQGKLVGLVLDMRENSGGFLNQAVKVAGLFITSGVIVISKYAHGEVQYLRDVDGRTYFNGPMLILASKASASAAEIVAQALQDYGAAIIVGDERTYGKGTIQYQTVTDNDANAFFKVTVGRYYTVSGKSTQIEGVKADIVVPTIYAPYNIGERFLEYPLTNDTVPSAYVDPLTDIDQRTRRWFQKNYLPNLQKKETQWVRMLPTIKDSSAFRLAHDKNFKNFLKALDGKDTGKENWGTDDLQMAEAVNILKDMIVLEKVSTNY